MKNFFNKKEIKDFLKNENFVKDFYFLGFYKEIEPYIIDITDYKILLYKNLTTTLFSYTHNQDLNYIKDKYNEFLKYIKLLSIRQEIKDLEKEFEE